MILHACNLIIIHLPYDVLLVFLIQNVRSFILLLMYHRTHNMFEQGWISETKALFDTSGSLFLKKKKVDRV